MILLARHGNRRHPDRPSAARRAIRLSSGAVRAILCDRNGALAEPVRHPNARSIIALPQYWP
jgi:hypothetical protein